MSDPLAAQVVALIATRMRHHIGAVPLDEQTVLFGGGLNLDSIAAVELVSLTEMHFGVAYDEEHLREDYFRTPRALADLLRRCGVTSRHQVD